MKQSKSIPSIKLYGINLLVFAFLFVTFACTEERSVIDKSSKEIASVEEIFKVVEQHPTYRGGMDAFYNRLRQEIEYPRAAREANVEGRVYVQFVIEKDGSISNVQTTQGIGSGCDEAAATVVQNVPSFQPGKQRGRPVRTQMIIPITFQLDKDQNGIVIIGEATYNAGFLKVDASYNQGEWSGVVRDPKGEPLPGANILISGKTKGTVSDLDGSFKMEASDSEVLSVSFVGYDSVSLDASVSNSN